MERNARAELRQALQRFAGGNLETGSSGGAEGMVFFVDRGGSRFYLGGFGKAADARAIVDAVNAALRL